MIDEKNPLPLLLVTEAIRELSKRFENLSEKESHIEHHICNLGKKPGFVMASHLILNSQDVEGFDEMCKFIATTFSKAMFNIQTKYQINNTGTSKKLTITFSEKIPLFQCLMPSGNHMNQQQQFWFNSYAQFVMGLYCGALLHFGYKAIPEFKQGELSSLTFSFLLEELEKTWEFSANA